MKAPPSLQPVRVCTRVHTFVGARTHACTRMLTAYAHKHESIKEMLTSLSVGLPMKKSVFLLLLGGLNLGFRKAHPFAMASRGAGPS